MGDNREKERKGVFKFLGAVKQGTRKSKSERWEVGVSYLLRKKKRFEDADEETREGVTNMETIPPTNPVDIGKR